MMQLTTLILLLGSAPFLAEADCVVTTGNPCNEALAFEVPNPGGITPHTGMHDQTFGVQLIRKGELLSSFIPTRTNVVYTQPPQPLVSASQSTVVVQEQPQDTVILNQNQQQTSAVVITEPSAGAQSSVVVTEPKQETQVILHENNPTKRYVITEPTYANAVLVREPYTSTNNAVIVKERPTYETVVIQQEAPPRPIYIRQGDTPAPQTMVLSPVSQQDGQPGVVIQTVGLQSLFQHLCGGGGCPLGFNGIANVSATTPEPQGC